MVKQTKTFKKGNVTKKALSAILAASMVMTSSSFVMAAPVDEVVVEETAVEGATAVEEVAVEEENTGINYTLQELTLDKKLFVKGDNTKTELKEMFTSENTVVKRTADSTSETGKYSDNYLDGNWETTVENVETKETVTLVYADDLEKLSTEIGTYEVKVTPNPGFESETDSLYGEAVARYSIVAADIEVIIDGEPVAADDYDIESKTFTNAPIEPVVESVKLDGKLLSNENYKVEYKDNTEIGTASIVISFVGADYAKTPAKTITFKIDRTQIGSAIVTMNDKSQTVEYDGAAHAPAVESVAIGGKTLVRDTDYEVKLVKRKEAEKPESYPTTEGESKEKEVSVSTSKAGVYDIYVVGKGNYKDQVLRTNATFEITQRELSAENVTVQVEDVEYTGAVTSREVFEPGKDGKSVVTVVDKKTKKTIHPSEYTIYYVINKGMDNTKKETSNTPVSKDVGEYEIEIVPNGINYKEADVALRATYNVVLNNLGFVAKNATVLYDDGENKSKLKYNGLGQLPYGIEFKGITDDEKVSKSEEKGKKEFSDFTVVYPSEKDCVNAGTYEIKLVGKNKYAGQTAVITFDIDSRSLPNQMGNTGIIDAADMMYAPISHVGNPEKPFVDIILTVAEEGKEAYNYQLVEDKDFTAVANTKKQEVTVTGKGNFTGTKVYKYKPNSTQTNLNDTAIKATMKKTFPYAAAQIKPSYDDFELTEVGPNGSRLVVPRADYVIKGYKNNIEVGTGYVIIEAAKDTVTNDGSNISFVGERWIPFEITANEVATAYKLDTSKVKDEIAYDGASHKYEVKFGAYNADSIMVKTVKDNAYVSVKERDSVKYFRDGKEITEDSDFRMPGTITVEVTMKNYSGKLSYSYTIQGKELTDAITIDYNIPDQKYTGEEIKPAVKIAEKNVPVGTILEGRDYKITYVNNVNPGRAYAVVEGIGNYSGKYYVPFNIIGKMDQKIDVLNVQERDLGNGTRTLNSKGTKIKYTVAPKTAVTYTSSNPDVVSVDAEGNIKYTGLGEATITIAAEEGDFYKAEKVEVKVVVTLKRPTMTLFTKDNAFTFTTSTVNGAKQFEIQYATNKEFKNAKSKVYSTTGKLRQVKVSAKDKTTYHVRIRAINGSTKTAWSAYKTVATK